MAENWKDNFEQFDFAISFSSIEHSGLGRYGEANDPMGDIREIEKLRCFLKPKGRLYLGVPTGIDTMAWNVHRIYGPVRWPMMMAGWKHMGTTFKADQKSKKLGKFWTNHTHNYRTQPVVILEKTSGEECG